MSSVGSILKDARNKKSISLEDVHSHTKIHPRVLQILEEDRFEKLPSPLFVKSFLKNYAAFLELNPAELVQMYETLDTKKSAEQQIFIRPQETPKTVFRLNASVWIALGVVGALIAVAWIIFYPKKMSVETQPERAVVAQRIQPAPLETKTEWLRSVSMGNYPKIRGSVPLELQVKATEDVWMQVTCDGKVLFKNVLKRGASETWSAEKSIEIWTGNSSNMKVYINRTPLGSVGRGVIRRMQFNREGVRIL